MTRLNYSRTGEAFDPMGAALADHGAVERVTADQLEPGDRFADARTHPAMTLTEIQSVGESSRWLQLERGGRIRPRHSKRFWRVVR